MSRALGLTLCEIREEIASLRGGRRYRQVRDHFVRRRIEAAEQRERSSIAKSTQANLVVTHEQLLSRCVLGRYESALEEVADGALRLVVADPPYGGRMPRSVTAAVARDCDHDALDAALAVTVPLFSICDRALSEDGVIILFQAGMRADRPDILHAASAAGFECMHALTWLKWPVNRLPRRSFEAPYAVASERILVFARKNGSELRRRPGRLAHPDVIYQPTTSPCAVARMDAGHRDHGDAHVYEKPVALCRLLLETHTAPGDLAFEPFGCTAPVSVASIQTGRRFLYAESNRANFSLGRRRIERALRELRHQSQSSVPITC